VAVDAVVLVLVMLALGVLFARLGALGPGAADTLNLVVLNVCLPAAVLLYVPRLQLELELLAVAVIPWLLMVAAALAVGLLGRLGRLQRDVRAVLLLGVGLGNTSFLGYPLVRALLGADHLPYAVIYDQFGSFLLLTTVGLLILARHAGAAPPTVRETVGRIVRFPPAVALVVGLTVMPAEPPSFLAFGLERLADALLPLVMLAVGLGLKLRMPAGHRWPLAAGLVLKLAIMPALALGLVRLVALPSPAAAAVVLESAMPPMVTAAALAMAQRIAPTLAAALVGYGIVASLATLPLWTWLLDRGVAG
jgi:predicted permease